MQNTSEVLLRNEHEFEHAKSLVLGLSDAALLSQWPNQDVQVVTNSWANKLRFEAITEQVVFGHVIEFDAQKVSLIVIVLPKSRPLLNFWLAQISVQITQPLKLLLVGEKNAGIQGAAKQLKEYASDVVKIDMARHCQLWQGRVQPGKDFVMQDWVSHFDVPETSIQCQSIPGVFNHGKLDAGTDLLLKHLGRISKGRILDFGCGAGVVGLSLKQLQPEASIEMVDVSAEAIYATQQSAESNKLDVQAYASNGLSEVSGRFHAIISNPPFHTGVKTDYQVTENFIRDCSKHLIEGGELRIVANAFLKYPSLIEQYIGKCDVLAENAKFKVYRARKRG